MYLPHECLLFSWRLDTYELKLVEMGATKPVDLLDMSDAHVIHLSLKPLEAARWETAIKDLKKSVEAVKSGKTASSAATDGGKKTTPSSENYEEPYIFEYFDAISEVRPRYHKR
jgi:hypothetical protein